MVLSLCSEEETCQPANESTFAIMCHHLHDILGMIIHDRIVQIKSLHIHSRSSSDRMTVLKGFANVRNSKLVKYTQRKFIF